MNNKGSLTFALLLILVLTVLNIAILLSSVNESWLAQRVANSSAALWAAEAGVQQSLWQYNYNSCAGMAQPNSSLACSSCSSCPVGSTLQGTLAGYGDYDVSIISNDYAATPNIQVHSVGSIPSRNSSKKIVRNVQANLKHPTIFSNGIFSQGCVNLKQNSLVNAYSSGLGNYGGTNIDNVDGNVGTNGTTAGTIQVDNNATVDGNVSTGPGGSITDNGFIAGQTTYNNSIALPAVIVPSSLTSLSSSGTLTVANNGSATINAGNYKYKSVSLGNKSTLTINGNVNLYLTGDNSQNSLSTGSGQVKIILNSGSNLVLYTDGTLTFNNNLNIINNSPVPLPSNFQIYSTYSSAISSACPPDNSYTYGITVSNNSTTYAAIYAPQTGINITNNAGFYGAVLGNTVNLVNNGDIHFDTALETISNPFENAIPTNWQEY